MNSLKPLAIINSISLVSIPTEGLEYQFQEKIFKLQSIIEQAECREVAHMVSFDVVNENIKININNQLIIKLES